MAAPHRTMKRFILCFLSAALLTFVIAACQPNFQTLQPETLRVGINYINAPWSFQDESGELVGFEIDFTERVAEALDMAVEYIDIPFIELFPAVASGRIDMAVAGITVTDKRMETVAFSQPYYDGGQSLTTRLDSGIGGVEDLASKKVGANAGTTGEKWTVEHQTRYQFGEIVRYEGSLMGAMDDLANGIIDGYITDSSLAAYYSQERPELGVMQRMPANEQFAAMFAKGNPLRDQVSDIITAFKTGGTMANIYEQWFGAAPEPGSSTVTVLPIPQLAADPA